MKRNEYIGSSDAMYILAGNWLELWQLKTGRKEPDDLTKNFKVQLGVHTEPFHLDWTLNELFYDYDNYELVREENYFALHHEMVSGVPFGSHPDALIRDLNEPNKYIPVEVKHTGRFRTVDDACDFYMPQIQHHMYCIGSKYCVFSVIRGNEEPERIWVEANDVYIRHYVSRCIEFWNYVLDDVAPAPFIEHTQVQPTIVDSIKRNGFKRRDLNGSNSANALIDRFLVTKPVVDEHNSVKNELKALMADDENELYHAKLTLKRNKLGHILFKLPKEESNHAS